MTIPVSSGANFPVYGTGEPLFLNNGSLSGPLQSLVPPAGAFETPAVLGIAKLTVILVLMLMLKSLL